MAKKDKIKNPKEELINNLPKDYILLQQTVQDFIPFEKIKDMMICLPNHLYRAVVEVKSINYFLKTEEEKETIEAMFRNAISSWDFSFAFYTQTRTIDSEEIMKNLRSDLEKVSSRELKAYGEEYAKEMEQLTKARNGNLIKKNYIIISCNDADIINPNVSDSQKELYAFDKLSLDVKKVYEALTPIGLVCNVLTNEELIELLFVAINKHSMLKATDIINQTTKLVSGSESWNEDKVEVLMEGFIKQLQDMLLKDHGMTGEEIDRAQKIIKEIENIRDRNKSTNGDLFVL